MSRVDVKNVAVACRGKGSDQEKSERVTYQLYTADTRLERTNMWKISQVAIEMVRTGTTPQKSEP